MLYIFRIHCTHHVSKDAAVLYECGLCIVCNNIQLYIYHRPSTVTSYILLIIVTYSFICTNLVSFLAVGCS